MSGKLSLSFLFFIYFSISLCAQKTNYQTFKNINLGAETSVINCFAQDSQGLIWVGSNKGLFSYDGYSAQPHFTINEESNTLIYCILVVDDTRLCLGTDNGVLFYNYKTDQYEKPDTSFPSDVRALALYDDTLWIGSLNGLYRYNLKDRKIENVSNNKDNGLPHKTIYSIIKTKDNTLYVGTYDGLCQYIPTGGRFRKINLPTDPNRSNLFINSLHEDTIHDCIWIGTEGALFKYKPKTKQIEEINFFHNNSIKSLVIDSNDKLLVGTDNGLYVYNQQNEEVQHIVHDSRNEKSLINNIIWGIFIDKENNIWLGTDYGISLSRYSKTFQAIPISEITGIGDGNRFHAVYKDSRNNLWLGGTNGLILASSLADTPRSSIWYRMGNKQHPLSHNRIRHIYEDQDQNLWVATDGSISLYNYTSQQFIHYNIIDSTHTYNSNWAYHIFEDNDNRLWIATCLGGVFVVDKQKLLKSSSNYIADYNFSTHNGLSGNFINQIIPDHIGNAWVLLYNNGIDKIDIKTKTIKKIPIKYTIKNENPNYIICDKEGFIWAGLRGGLVRINPQDDTLESIRFDDFSNSEIFYMIEEGSNIWVSTTDGVWVVNKQSYKVQRLNATGRSFTSGFFDKQSNKIYFGGADELAIMSTDILKGNNPYFPVILTAVYINDKLYTNPNNSIRHMEGIDLDYNQNNLSFEFSDLAYSEEESNKFVYKLEGVDKDWNILKQNTNKISYSNLEYGKYNLIITKLDLSGKPSDVVYSFAIEINPPWYYTIWAKSIYVIFIIALVLWIINFFRVRNNLKVERIEKEKTLELSNLKIDFFTNVSHEFKTPLSLIIAPISQLLLDIKDSQKKKQLEGIQRNALKLNTLIRQVLDFNRTDSNTNSNLIFSKVEFVEFSRSLFSVYEEGYKEKDLKFSFRTNKENIYIYIDVLKIESVLNNMLSNACKYIRNNGEIVLSLTYKSDNNTLDIIVSDTGIGIPQNETPYVFERFYQSSKTSKDKEGTGIGLYLVKTYTEQHGGKITLQSEENKGTTLTITLPLRNEATVENQLQTEEETTETSKPLILVVDDNTEIADFISQILVRKYRCAIAHNGKMGMEMCFQLHPDLIIADIMMPIMNGLEMSRRIRKNIPTSTTPIILLTAKDDKTTELESITINVDAFIPKPFDSQILLSRIEQLLKSKQQIEEKLRIENITTPKMVEVTSLDEKFLSEITQIIEDRINDSDLNVNFLCTISGIGSKQVYRKIKQLTGMSPVEYIRSIRLKKAAMLLTQKKFTVAEVMYMVGFSNHSYFSKCFQTEFGKTPREYLAD